MKKLSLLIAASAMATCVVAGPQTWVTFSSVGPDKYADGTEVQDGEYYALVWTPTGKTFAGFTADGNVNEPSRLVLRGRFAENKHCKEICFVIRGEDAILADSGSFALYLLDTRTRPSAEEDLSVDTTAGLTAVATQTEVLAKVATGAETVAETSVSSSAAVATADPVNAKTPKIAGIEVVEGKVYVTVANTMPCLQYGISSGDTPTNLEKNDLVKGVNGTESGTITLVVDDPKENRFFKVTRK